VSRWRSLCVYPSWSTLNFWNTYCFSIKLGGFLPLILHPGTTVHILVCLLTYHGVSSFYDFSWFFFTLFFRLSNLCWSNLKMLMLSQICCWTYPAKFIHFCFYFPLCISFRLFQFLFISFSFLLKEVSLWYFHTCMQYTLIKFTLYHSFLSPSLNNFYYLLAYMCYQGLYHTQPLDLWIS
jgi:hypothetical protein